MFFKRKRTVADIVAPITSIVNELRVHEQAHLDKADRHYEQVEHHHDQAAIAKGEAAAASAAAGKIGSLV